MKKLLLILLMFSVYLLTSSPVLAQLSLYRTDDSFLYPEIYPISKVERIKDLPALTKSLSASSSAIVGYLLASDSASAKVLSYSNTDLPHIKYKRINPVLYEVTLDSRDKDVLLVFGERFHPGWSLRESDHSSKCSQSLENKRFKVAECRAEQDRYNIPFLIQLPFTAQLGSLDHFEINHFMNAWLIPKGSVKTFYIFFDVESYMLIGLVISAGTVAIFAIYFMWYFLKHSSIMRK